MAKFEDQQFREKNVVVDADQFVNCSFFDCNIIFGGTTIPVLMDCHFERCRFGLQGAALPTATWLTMIYHRVGGDAGLRAMLNIPVDQ